MKLEYNLSKKIYIFSCTYDEKHVAKNAGFRWDRGNKYWYTDSAITATKLIAYADEGTKLFIAEKKQTTLAVSQSSISTIYIDSPSGLSYLDYQRAGIEYASARQDTLIADEMGLGKTIQAIGVVNYLKLKKILIICPASLKKNWEKEAQKWVFDKSLKIKVLKKPEDVTENNILITNYESVKKYKPLFLQQYFDLLICDESHYLKNPKAQRTKEILGYGKEIQKITASKRLFLTGTPVLNRPIELFAILKSCGIYDNWKFFAERYCNAQQDRYGWHVNGSSNAKELGEILREKLMVRRKKEEVLKELPKKIRQVLFLEQNQVVRKAIESEKTQVADYERKKTLIKQQLAELHKKGLAGGEEYKNQVKEMGGYSADFIRLSGIRHATAFHKIDAIAEITENIVEQKGCAVVFTHHVDVAQKISEKLSENGLKTAVFSGETSIDDRNKIVENFQSGKIDVFVSTISAGGVGITLTRADTVIFAELEWSPALVAQAEDRCHRIGQENPVQSIYCVYENSIDAMLAQTIVEKTEIIDDILNNFE